MATNHDRPTRRCSGRADSCRAATWDDLRRKAGRGGRTTVDDRGETELSKARRKAQRADLRGRGSSDEVFPATHESGYRHGMAEYTTSLKSTPSTRAARKGACEREHVGQHVDSDAGKTMECHGERFMECHEDR